MHKILKNKPLLVSIGINACLFLLFFAVFYSRYGTTDDVEMQMILSGKAVINQPYAYLRYTHVFIGFILSFLYENIPSIPWYGSYLSLAHFMGMTAILYSILLLRPSIFSLSFYLLIFLVGETLLLQELQFTSSSIVLCSGGLLLLYVEHSSVDKGRLGCTLVAILALIWGSMIRWESFQLSLILGIPLLVLASIESQKWKTIWIGMLGITTSAFLIHQSHYLIENQDPSWKNYNNFKQSLSAHNILDYQKSQYLWNENTADDYFYKVGWEYEDFQLFKQWFFADTTVFGLQQFSAIQSSFEDCPTPVEDIEERSWNFWIEQPLSDYVFHAFLVLAIALMCIKVNRWTYTTLFASATMVYLILYSLFLLKHLPERVSFPMGFYLIALSAIVVAKNIAINRQTKFFSLVLLALLALSSTKSLIKQSSQTALQKQYWTAALDSLNATSDQLYIGGGDFYMQAILTPFHPTQDSLIDHFNMLDFGHLSNAPVHFKQLDYFGIDNIHTQAVRDSSIFLVHRFNAPILQWYAHFLHRHYNMHIEYELLRKENKVDIAVYRIREQIRTKKNSQGINLKNMHEFGIDSISNLSPFKRADFKEQEIFYFVD